MNSLQMNLKGLSEFEQLKQTVEDQEEIIQKQAQEIERLQDTVYQLIGGLFNQQKQAEQIDLAVAMLRNRKPKRQQEDDPDYYTVWPTTRQGDDLEQRMTELETKMEKIDGIFSDKQRKVYSQATLPVELLSPKKRTINSHWLCGNE